MKKTATESELAALHNKLAEVLRYELDKGTVAERLLDEFSDELPDEVIDFLQSSRKCSPAIVSAAIKFLKDNEITCQADDNEAISELHRTLANKRTRSSVANIVSIDDTLGG